MKAVDFARDVLEMHERICWLEGEVFRLQEYERKYHELLGESLEHNKAMCGSLFALGMKLAAEEKTHG